MSLFGWGMLLLQLQLWAWVLAAGQEDGAYRGVAPHTSTVSGGGSSDAALSVDSRSSSPSSWNRLRDMESMVADAVVHEEEDVRSLASTITSESASEAKSLLNSLESTTVGHALIGLESTMATGLGTRRAENDKPTEFHYATPWGGLKVPRALRQVTKADERAYVFCQIVNAGCTIFLLFIYYEVFFGFTKDLFRDKFELDMRKNMRNKLHNKYDKAWEAGEDTKLWDEWRFLSPAQGGEEFDEVVKRFQRGVPNSHGLGSREMVRTHLFNHPSSLRDSAQDNEPFKDEIRRLDIYDMLRLSDEIAKDRQVCAAKAEKLADKGVDPEYTIWKLEQIHQLEAQTERSSALSKLSYLEETVICMSDEQYHQLRSTITDTGYGITNKEDVKVAIQQVADLCKRLPNPETLGRNLDYMIETLKKEIEDALNAGAGGPMSHIPLTHDPNATPMTDEQADGEIVDAVLARKSTFIIGVGNTIKAALGMKKPNNMDVGHKAPYSRMLPGHLLKMGQAIIGNEILSAFKTNKYSLLMMVICLLQTAVVNIKKDVDTFKKAVQTPCWLRNPDAQQKSYGYGVYSPSPACPVDGAAWTLPPGFMDSSGKTAGYWRVSYTCDNVIEDDACQGTCYKALSYTRQIIHQDYMVDRVLGSIPTVCARADVQLVDPYNLLHPDGTHFFNPHHMEYNFVPGTDMYVIVSIGVGNGTARSFFQMTFVGDNQVVDMDETPLFQIELSPASVVVSTPHSSLPPHPLSVNNDPSLTFCASMGHCMPRKLDEVVTGDLALFYVRIKAEYTGKDPGYSVHVNGEPITFVKVPALAPELYIWKIATNYNLPPGTPPGSFLPPGTPRVHHSSVHSGGSCGSVFQNGGRNRFRKGLEENPLAAGTCVECDAAGCPHNHRLHGCVGSNPGQCVRCYDCLPGQQRLGCHGFDVGECRPMPLPKVKPTLLSVNASDD